MTKKKLLIVTQALDADDTVLGFFLRWIEELAKVSDSIEVICLREGRHELPDNVRVHCLRQDGEKRRSRYVYARRFFKLARKLSPNYNTVFVHMNQEYVLIAGLYWFFARKRVFLWRNHGKGNWKTKLAGFFSKKVFATSKSSYTAKFRNAVMMPVGVDLSRFTAPAMSARIVGSTLMVGRISPTKHVREVVDAFSLLALRGMDTFTLTVVGDARPEDEEYRVDLMAAAASRGVSLSLRGGMPHTDLIGVYSTHDVVVNVSDLGMYDKTMLEALAAGCLLLTNNPDLSWKLDERLQTDGTPSDIADKLVDLSLLSSEDHAQIVQQNREIAKLESLDTLMKKLTEVLYA